MRRSMLAMAVPTMLLALAACGGGGEDTSGATETTTQSSRTTTTATTTTSPTEQTSSSTTSTSTSRTSSTTSSPTSTSSEPTATSTSSSASATTIATLWVDDTWQIEQLDQDVCMGGLSESPYSHQDELFTCGPTAASADACAHAEGGVTTCITDPVRHTAIRFDSPTVEDWDGQLSPRGGDPIPLYVDLTDGARCATISHDHDRHWGGRYSWYRCDDGSELLTRESIQDTFDDDEAAWTAERSVGKGAPTTTTVRTAVFAGR